MISGPPFDYLLAAILGVAATVGGAWVIRKSPAGPANEAYVDALEGRLTVVTAERDDLRALRDQFQDRIRELERKVAGLEDEVGELKGENLKLYRRLDESDVGRRRSRVT